MELQDRADDGNDNDHHYPWKIINGFPIDLETASDSSTADVADTDSNGDRQFILSDVDSETEPCSTSTIASESESSTVTTSFATTTHLSTSPPKVPGFRGKIGTTELQQKSPYLGPCGWTVPSRFGNGSKESTPFLIYQDPEGYEPRQPACIEKQMDENPFWYMAYNDDKENAHPQSTEHEEGGHNNNNNNNINGDDHDNNGGDNDHAGAGTSSTIGADGMMVDLGIIGSGFFSVEDNIVADADSIVRLARRGDRRRRTRRGEIIEAEEEEPLFSTQDTPTHRNRNRNNFDYYNYYSNNTNGSNRTVNNDDSNGTDNDNDNAQRMEVMGYMEFSIPFSLRNTPTGSPTRLSPARQRLRSGSGTGKGTGTGTGSFTGSTMGRRRGLTASPSRRNYRGVG